MKVLILCGGRGTRLNGERPKPLIEIGGRPIVWHVMSIYAAQGFEDFLLLTGYQGEAVADWARSAPWRVECVDTGLDTPTGGRVHAVRERLGEPFCLTYADGLADIDLAALVGRHRSSGALATMTVVRPELPFGIAMLDGERVTGFREKPRAEQWVNGGFLVMEPRRSATCPRTRCSSASRWSEWPPTARWPRTATTATGAAWTPTRTPWCWRRSGRRSGALAARGELRLGRGAGEPAWAGVSKRLAL